MKSGRRKMPCALRRGFCHACFTNAAGGIRRHSAGFRVHRRAMPPGAQSRTGDGGAGRDAARAFARARRTCTLQWHRPRDCMMATLRCHVVVVHGPAFAKWQCKTLGCEVTRRPSLLTSQPFTMLRPARRRTSERSAWNKAQALDGLGARQIWLTNILAQQTSARSQAMEDVPHLAPHRSIA